MPRKIKILRCPSLNYNFSGLLPFGLATICSDLRHNGYDIDQDDLDAWCSHHGTVFPRHRWGKDFPAKQWVRDMDRMRRFWTGGEDPEVTGLVEQILSFTNLDGYDTILLSL